MEITTTEVTAGELHLDTMAIRNQGHEERPAGIHVTNVIVYLEETILKTRKPNRDWNDWKLSGDVGFWLEDALARGMTMQSVVGVREGALVRPGSLVKDDLWLTPDGFDLDDWADWECKATWKSMAKNPPEDNWYWMAQFKAYCLAMGTRTTKLTALYVCGDYTPPRPRMVKSVIQFTDEELKKNWAMLVKGAESMRAKGITGH